MGEAVKVLDKLREAIREATEAGALTEGSEHIAVNQTTHYLLLRGAGVKRADLEHLVGMPVSIAVGDRTRQARIVTPSGKTVWWKRWG